MPRTPKPAPPKPPRPSPPRPDRTAPWFRRAPAPRRCGGSAFPVDPPRRIPPSPPGPPTAADAGEGLRHRAFLGSTVAIRVSGAGTLLRIAIRWMMCHGRHPPPMPRSCLFEKFGWPSPRRQQPIYQGPDAPCRSPSDCVRSSRSQPSRVATLPTRPCGSGCAATAGRESAGSCRRPEILGSEAAAGEGTAIQIFRMRGYWLYGADARVCTGPPDRDP